VLKASLGSNGYLTVRLNGKTAAVHQLVLKTFRGPRPDGMVACHDDGRKTNNALTNLAWGTPSSNQLDRYRHELDPFARGKDGRILPGKRQKQEVNHV
jgi:HNH endonuclease